MPYNARTLDQALAAPEAQSLDAVLTRLDAADLSPIRRRDLASAVRRVAAAIDHDPTDAPADPLWLRPRIARIAPAAIGLSQKSWTNVLSDFRAALAVAGVASGRSGRGKPVPMPPAWAALRDALPDKRRRIGLSRFMQFCARLGLEPTAVDDAVLTDFEAALSRSEIRKNPALLVRDVAVFWNQAADAIPDWPATRFAIPDRRNQVALPWDAFTDAFRADVDAYLARLAVADLCDPDAPAHPLTPETIAGQRALIRRFASAILRQGRAPESVRSLADLVAPETAKLGLRFFLARNDGRPQRQLGNIVSLLKAIARWHVRAEPETIEALRGLGRKLAQRGGGMTPKNRARLRQFDEGAAIRDLLALPDRLVARADRARNPCAAARSVEIALAVALLLHCPMRIENLRTLSLERHIVGRPGGRRRIVIPAEEVKNRIELDYPLPDRVTALLDRFVRDHRKALNPAPGPYLFPQREAPRPTTGAYLGQRISRAIRSETGLAVNPHLFRHITAKIYLRAHPGGYEVVRRLLGHSRTFSTIDCYAGFETDAATRDYAAILERATGPAPRPRRGRR